MRAHTHTRDAAEVRWRKAQVAGGVMTIVCSPFHPVPEMTRRPLLGNNTGILNDALLNTAPHDDIHESCACMGVCGVQCVPMVSGVLHSMKIAARYDERRTFRARERDFKSNLFKRLKDSLPHILSLQYSVVRPPLPLRIGRTMSVVGCGGVLYGELDLLSSTEFRTLFSNRLWWLRTAVLEFPWR